MTTQDQLIVQEFCIDELATANIALMEQQIREIPEKPETKDQYDAAYRYNVDAKKLIPRIEERRKELKAPVLEKSKLIDSTAKNAKAMVQPLIDLSGARRQAWEDEKAAEKAEKDRVESDRLASIQAKVDMLNHLAAKPMEYNRAAADIAKDLTHLEAFEVSAIDFQERTHEAEWKKEDAIKAAKAAFENRKKFEADKAEADRVKAENEAEAKRLAAQQAEIEQRVAEAEAKIEADKKALEKEKAEAAQSAIIAEREAVWDVAHNENERIERDLALANREIDHGQALIENAHIDALVEDAERDEAKRIAQTEQAKADAAERLKLIGPDKLMILATADSFDDWISNCLTPNFETQEAMTAYHDLITRIKTAVSCFEKEGLELK